MAEPIVDIPEGFQVYGNSVMAYLDADDILHTNVNALCIMIPSEAKKSVVEAMPECVPGTMVFLSGWVHAWQYGIDGTWTQIM